MAKKRVRTGVRILAWLVTVPVLVLGVGWIFHTSFEPAVFGKYSAPYFTFLVCWWLLVTPAMYFFARFVFDTQRITLTSGRVLHVRPSLKILLTLALGWGMAAILEYRINKALGHGVTTAQRTDVYHPYLQNVPKPRNRYAINGWGYRGSQIEKEKPADTFRIFALGGSTTFSGPLKLKDTYPEMLAVQLRAKYPGRTIEVQNAGADWHCSQHSLVKFLTSIQDFDPDLLLVFHGINDLVRSLSPDLFSIGAFREDYRHYLGPVSSLIKKDAKWPLVRMRFGYWFSDFLSDTIRMTGPEGGGVGGGVGQLGMAFVPKTEPVEIDSWPSLATYDRTMRDLIATAQAKGVQIVIATQPHLFRKDLTARERELLWAPRSHQFNRKRVSVSSMLSGMNLFNKRTEEIAGETGAGFVDLASVVPKSTEYLYDEVHHTKKATAKIAAAFVEHIEKHKLLDK